MTQRSLSPTPESEPLHQASAISGTPPIEAPDASIGYLRPEPGDAVDPASVLGEINRHVANAVSNLPIQELLDVRRQLIDQEHTIAVNEVTRNLQWKEGEQRLALERLQEEQRLVLERQEVEECAAGSRREEDLRRLKVVLQTVAGAICLLAGVVVLMMGFSDILGYALIGAGLYGLGLAAKPTLGMGGG